MDLPLCFWCDKCKYIGLTGSYEGRFCPNIWENSTIEKTQAVENKNIYLKIKIMGKRIERTIYIVTRETIDYHNDSNGGLRDKEIVGTFTSRNEANEAARINLLGEWDRDFFESYEVEEEDGLVTVSATCPEGEEMSVSVERMRNKISLGPKSSNPLKRKIYHVTRETIDYHNDYYGGLRDTAVVGTFFSRKKANQAAREDLLNDWDIDWFESYEVDEEDGLVTVTAVCPEGEEMTVTVEEGELNEGHGEDIDEDSDEESDEDSDGELDGNTDADPDEESNEESNEEFNESPDEGSDEDKGR